jgi:hypothetical protein
MDMRESLLHTVEITKLGFKLDASVTAFADYHKFFVRKIFFLFTHSLDATELPLLHDKTN